MLKAKSKSQPARLLSYGQSTSTSVAVASMISAGGTAFAVILLLIILGMVSGINRHTKGMSIIQLEDGSISNGKIAGPSERDNETIKRFISNSLIEIFGWNGLIEAKENGENITKADKGIEINIKNKGKKAIPTRTWEAAFALSEKKDFRASFLQALAELVPNGVFSGEVQSSLITRYVSKPRKVKDGKWEVDYLGTLVSFDKNKNQGRGTSFNKTITVEAVDTPKLPKNPTKLDEKIYSAREAGLEITEIIEYNLGKK